jgi:conjugative relaxase-like TrwC/TraI family protein
VVADVAKLSVGREAYYTRELAADHEAYLSGHGESPGRWYGHGAAALGLQGEASVAGFQRMFEGRHPDTGELLGRPHGSNAVPAFDVVLRPTKSVSILYGLGDAATGRAVLDAHQVGVREAVAYLDGHLGTRRGHGGVQHVSGQGLLAVGFDHRTSREGDPLLHTHLVVANRVQGPDGRWTALDGRDLYRHRLAADAIYPASYQRELVRTLGVEWTAADAHGNRELVGVPDELVRLFSKRADQIDLEVERLEAEGRGRTPRLVKWAVHATRKPKEQESLDTLYGRWRTEAAERGVDPDTLVRQVTSRTRQQDRTVSERTVSKVFDRLAGPSGLTAQASTFARQDVIAALGGGLAGATRVELEELADRFLAERTVAVVAKRAVEERRWSTPELLAVEQRLVAAAVDRSGEQTAVVSHDAVRAALQAHPSVGDEQQAMVRDACQGDAGVVVVVGRAGTGKTFALGIARHAWQLDGYRPLACAPTGIATVSLEAEGFEEVATCDRLLADLDRGREQLDSRTVLVVDEAGMLGSRKLARLLDHTQQAQAKVVLVGDDRQLASIDAGGGFRALRLRLGVSELTENRRQQQAWEREALELVRDGLVEEAVAAYRAHDRVVAAESKPAATLALLQDWRQAYQDSEVDPSQNVIVLAGRRAEVDRLNTACQQLLAAGGRLSQERLQVEDRKLAVGDRVVCGRNAISQLGIANGTRGTITALDPDTRTLTLRLDGKDPREVTLPGWYLDGRGRGERNRRVDLAYATTGHRAQGLTRWRALVRLTGTEDANWLYVQLSRARHQTTLYPVVGPEPQGPAELDLPDRDPGDGYTQLAQTLSRAGDQTLAIDTPSSLDLRRLSTGELRAERDRLRGLLDQAPPDRARELERASARRADADRALERLTATNELPRQGRGMLGLRWRGGPAGAGSGVVAVARQQADRTHTTELKLRRQQQRRAGWLEANAHLGPAYRQVVRELAWQRRATGLAAEHDQPDYLREELGPVPESTRGWRPGGRPPPRSRTTAVATTSATPTRRWARRRRSRSSGPPGTRPAPPPSRPRTASAPPTARSARHRPAQPPATAAIQTPPMPATSGRLHADAARSGRPASTSEGGQPWPGPTPPSPTPTDSGPTVTRSRRASRSGPSATATFRPCSPTSATTSTTTGTRAWWPRRPGDGRPPAGRWWRCGCGPASAAPAPPPRPSIGAGGPPNAPPGPAACPGGLASHWPPP